MDIKKVLDGLPMYAIFEKQQFREVVHQIYPEYKESSINWLLMKLKDENEKNIVVVEIENI